MIVRFVMTLIYAVIGVYVAFPLSYWFQGRIYHEMTWGDYVNGGVESLRIGMQFGAGDVYRYTVFGSVIGMVIIGRLVEYFITLKCKKSI